MRFVPIIIFATILAFFLAALLQPKDSVQLRSEAAAKRQIPEFSLATLDASSPPFTPGLWHGKKAIINLFASWCVPCAMEHPALMTLANTHRIPIYGIAWNDTPEKIREWLENRGNPYRAVGIDDTRATTIALGISGVPETFVVDDDGTILLHLREPLDEDSVKHILEMLHE